MKYIAAAVLGVVLVGCSNDVTVPSKNPISSVSQGLPDKIVESIPVNVQKFQAANGPSKCDWGGATIIDKTNGLISKHKPNALPGTVIILENENEDTCTGDLVVKVAPGLANLKQKATRRVDLLSPTEFEEVSVAGIEQNRNGCLSLMSTQGIVSPVYETTQAIVYANIYPLEAKAFVTMDVSSRRVNVGGNGGFNCVKVNSAGIQVWADSIWTDGFYESTYLSWPPRDQDQAYLVMNQAPGNPGAAGSLSNAYCQPGSCLASLYRGRFVGFHIFCPNAGFGISEARNISVKNSTSWANYYYIHMRTDGIVQVAGWGYPSGFPATFSTCTQFNGFPLALKYAVLLA